MKSNEDREKAIAIRADGWGRVAFAATLTGLGILGLIEGVFTPIWLPVPQELPAREVVVYLSAIVAFASGIGLFRQRTAAVASAGLLVFLLAWLLLLDAPQWFLDPGMQLTWAASKTTTMLAAAWVLSVRFNGGRGLTHLRFVDGNVGLRIARALYGLALIPFGIAHFTYMERTASMVPAWLPWPVVWASFFGVTFIAAGLAVLGDFYARLAAMLSALQLGMFTVLVWVPVVLSGPSASDWREFVVSWALTAAAWVVADSYHDMPWLMMR